jgi:hypothetical protein
MQISRPDFAFTGGFFSNDYCRRHKAWTVGDIFAGKFTVGPRIHAGIRFWVVP